MWAIGAREAMERTLVANENRPDRSAWGQVGARASAAIGTSVGVQRCSDW